MFDFKKTITEFHYGKFNIFLYLLLFVPCIFYFIAIKIKNFLYDIKILKEQKVNAKVICVGNLTTGGVGKTPFVIELANFFSKTKRTVIISRGYKGRLDNKKINLIRDYDNILIDEPELTGDEPALISRKVNNAALITSSNRLKAANYAIQKLRAEVILLDDGFSNRKLKKNRNIILVDSKKMFGNNFLLPLGPLREPLSEIKRADIVYIVDKGGEYSSEIDSFTKKLKIPFFICKMKTGSVYNIKTNEQLPDGFDVAAFSGIGSPNQFYESLKGRFNPVSTLSFDDHKEYDVESFNKINAFIKQSNVKYALTTEKDMVKLLKYNPDNIFAVEMKAEFDKDIFNSIL